MATIGLKDEIFATLTQRGNIVVSIKLTGMASYNDVLRYLRKMIHVCKGMVTLKLRNLTKGWKQEFRLKMEESEPLHVEATQLSLF